MGSCQDMVVINQGSSTELSVVVEQLRLASAPGVVGVATRLAVLFLSKPRFPQLPHSPKLDLRRACKGMRRED